MRNHYLYEAISPSLSPKPPRGTMGAASSAPVFLDTNGNPISSIACGGSYGFDVPGAVGGTIWLTEYKNGQKTFDGLFAVPMPTYTSTCADDVGTYQAIAFDPASGMVLGQTTFTVLPAGQTPPGIVPGSQPATTGGILDTISNLSTTGKVALAAAAFLLLRRL